MLREYSMSLIDLIIVPSTEEIKPTDDEKENKTAGSHHQKHTSIFTHVQVITLGQSKLTTHPLFNENYSIIFIHSRRHKHKITRPHSSSFNVQFSQSAPCD